MWPWGHAAFAYVVYTGLSLLSRRRPPTTVEALLVVVGSQIPDLVDKPLSWTLGILASGRSLGHSVLVWAVVAVFAVLLAHRFGYLNGTLAVLIGYLTGILGDVPSDLSSGGLSEVTFLLWPLLSSPETDVDRSIIARFSHLEAADVYRLQLFVVVLVGGHLVLRILARRVPARK